jgi:hypothetical protein
MPEARIELRGARGNRLDAEPGEARLDIREIQDAPYFHAELIDDRLRRTLGREQRGPDRSTSATPSC